MLVAARLLAPDIGDYRPNRPATPWLAHTVRTRIPPRPLARVRPSAASRRGEPGADAFGEHLEIDRMSDPSRSLETRSPTSPSKPPDGGSVKPSDFRGRKLVLFFYPKDDTPGCTSRRTIDFSALAGEFEKADTALLG